MTKKIVPYISFTLAALSFIFLLPLALQNKILEGQMGKQTFSAEMARSYSRGLIQNGFPLRHFPEVYHSLPDTWAEEFPLYTGLVAALSALTSLDLIILGRFMSLLAFLLLLTGAFRFGKIFFKEKEAPWMCLCIASCFPAFRIYATSFMPDLWMSTSCLWVWIFAWEKKWLKSGIWATLACLFKYYAVFTVLGICLYRIYSERSLLKPFFWGLFTSFLSISYIFYFIHQGIPNPITDYIYWNEAGHLGLGMLLKIKFYARLITWNVIKNPGILYGIISILGSILFFKSNFPLWKNSTQRSEASEKFVFISTQMLSGILFMSLFSSAFFVHDYYGLQWALITLFFSTFTLLHFKNLPFLNRGLAWVENFKHALLFAGLVISILFTRSATTTQKGYELVAQILQKNTSAHEEGLFLTERVGEASLFIADRSAWFLRLQQWQTRNQNTNSKLDAYFEKRVADTKVAWFGILLIGEDATQRLQPLIQELGHYGWTHLIEKSEFQAQHRKDTPSVFALLRRGL